MLPEVGLARAGGKAEVLASAFRVEPGRHRKRLHQCGLSGAIVTGQHRHPRVEIQPAKVPQRGDGRHPERLPRHPDALGLELDPTHEPALGWRDRPANRCATGIHPATLNTYSPTKERRMDTVTIDQKWRGWLHGLLSSGAEALGADLVGEPVLGLRGRSIGCRAATAEWDDHHRRARAELMTLAPGPAVATDMALRHPVDLDDAWWAELRISLDALASHPTDRVCLGTTLLQRWLLATFGVTIDPGALSWRTAHGDLHWANLTNPGCWLLDWESWGSAPAGYDAALLHGASLLQLQPAIAERISDTFADILTGPGAAVAHLAATAKLLRLVDYGDHPDLALPLHRHARTILAT
jgi:hypothetical protein